MTSSPSKRIVPDVVGLQTEDQRFAESRLAASRLADQAEHVWPFSPIEKSDTVHRVDLGNDAIEPIPPRTGKYLTRFSTSTSGHQPSP